MNFVPVAMVSMLAAVVTEPAVAQSGGHMMDGMWNGSWMGSHSSFGGFWGPIVFVAVVGLVVWAILQARK